MGTLFSTDSIYAVLRIFIATVIRYFILAGFTYIVCYILFTKSLAHNKIQNRKASVKDIKREILHSLQTTFFFAVVGFAFLSPPLGNYTLIYNNINDFPIWYIPISIFLMMLAHDTYFYFLHRIMHMKAFFKMFHVVHHKSVAPTPFTSYSFNLSESILEALITPLLLFIIPVHPMVFSVYIFIALTSNVYGHCGYEILPKSFRKTWLYKFSMTAVYHNLHHSKFHYNFSLYFRHWDRIFKTEYPKYDEEYDRIQEERFGRSNIQEMKPQRFPSKPLQSLNE